MNPLEYGIPEFMTQIMNLPPDPNNRTEDPGLDQLTVAVFHQRMMSLSSLDDKFRHNFIKSNIDLISNQILDGTCQYFKQLLEPVFLLTYKDILASMPPNMNRTMAANKLVYSYKFMKNRDTSTSNLFFAIAQIVNSGPVTLLKGIGLDEITACELCIARYSSADEMINVNRLNYEIYTHGAMMTEQIIIWIYEQLFNQMRYLFTATMLESNDTMTKYAVDFKDTHDTNMATPDEFDDAFAQTSLALLTLVNNMPLESIDALIRIFVEQWRAVGSPMTRFSLRALSADFGRIRHVVEQMSEKEHYYVP